MNQLGVFITEDKLELGITEEELKSMEKYYRYLPVGFHVVRVILDQEGKACSWQCVFANDELIRLIGLPAELLLQENCCELFPGWRDSCWLEQVYEAAYHGVRSTMTNHSTVLHKYLTVTACQFAYGYAACTISDVTQDHLFGKVLNSAALVYREVYFVHLEANYCCMIYPLYEHMGEMHNYEEQVARLVENGKISIEDEESVQKFLSIQKIKETLQKQDVLECRYKRKLDETNYERCLASLTVCDQIDGIPQTAIMTFRSIENVIKKEVDRNHELAKAVERAETESRAKSDFLSMMSHDIRTPLNVIIGTSSIAKLNLDDRERVSKCMDQIGISGEHLMRLVDEVLDVSKIESGNLNLRQEEFSLADLLKKTVLLTQGLIGARKHTLDFVFDDMEHENVVGDEHRLQQVLLNIISNAVKYSENLLQIEFAVAETVMPGCSFNMYQFKITDHGMGMSKEFLQHMFQPYTREHNCKTNEIAGTGLGLYIAKNILEQMGGTLTVTSQREIGTAAVIQLPLKAQENQPQNGPFKDWKVLLMDDCSSRKSVRLVLHGLQLRVEEAETSAEALKLLWKAKQDKDPFTCVLIDDSVLADDRIAIVKAIHREFDENLPVLITGESQSAAKTREAGVSAVLNKPLFRSDLLIAFQHMVESGEPSAYREIAAEREGKRQLHVLVAEDNYVNTEIDLEIFKYFGVKATVVENGREAVRQLEQEPRGTYDCVFMDLQMPVMNGITAAQIIRRSYSAKELPIFAMTANVLEREAEKCKEAGMQEHIGKPVTLEAIRQILEKYFTN